MNTTLIIAKREFKSYFDSPLAYVVICLSMLLLGVAIFIWPGKFWQVDRASLSLMFEAIPAGLALLVVPVITMRLVAEEKRSGTLEMLITLPVKDSDVIVGKFLGALGLVLVLVFSTILYPILMFKVWNLGIIDTGPVFSGYLGLVLFSAAAVAIGLLISSVTESQVVAFFVTFIVLFALFFMGELSEHVPNLFGTVFRTLSLKEHYFQFERGLIDLRDVLFFLSCAALALVLAFRSLESRKWT
jgi:gliding motility-associated transport system permease protein